MKHICTLLLFSLITSTSFGQCITKGFQFQGYASGAALVSETIEVKFSLNENANSTEPTFSEEHTTITTDGYGVFNVAIGSIQTTDWRLLNFNTTNYFLKVEVRGKGGNYTTIHNSPMQSVPYAKHAGNGVLVWAILPLSYGGAVVDLPSGWALCDGKKVDGTDPEWTPVYNAIGNAMHGEALVVPVLASLNYRVCFYVE